MRSYQSLEKLGRGIASAAGWRWQSAASRGYAADAAGTTDSTSGDGPSTSDAAPIFASCVLQRLPLVRPQIPAAQLTQLTFERQRALEAGEMKDYPPVNLGKDDTGNKQQQQDLRTFTPVPVVTAADASGDVRSMRRCLADSVYLVVRGAGAEAGGRGQQAGGGGPGADGGWAFPHAANTGEESISDTAQRALFSAIGRSHPVFFIGNGPMGHVRALPNGKTFFMLAQAVDDPWDTKLLPGGAAQEYAWVTKQELLSSYLADARLRELVSKML